MIEYICDLSPGGRDGKIRSSRSFINYTVSLRPAWLLETISKKAKISKGLYIIVFADVYYNLFQMYPFIVHLL